MIESMPSGLPGTPYLQQQILNPGPRCSKTDMCKICH